MNSKWIRALAAMAMAALMALTGVSALAQAATLTVQGTGTVTVEPDRATINIGVQEVSRTVGAAMSGVNEKLDSVVSALVERGIDEADIATSTVEIYANYDYDVDQRLLGYTASNTVTVLVTDVDSAGAIIDAAVVAGANCLNGVEFFAADTSEARKQALALAVESAREKAEALAEAAGLPLGGILEIREGDSGWESPMLYAKAEDAGAGTQLYAGRQQVTASVTVVYALGGAG
ncbi:MAG: SIMPL domain-containing protein [Clostridia bacterium]|nr:SIMPL domain-containing protein [Clostridia bacterium]